MNCFRTELTLPLCLALLLPLGCDDGDPVPGGSADAGMSPEDEPKRVNKCIGRNCPSGECDDDSLRDNAVPCAGLYPQPLDDAFEYCPAALAGGYCLASAKPVGAFSSFEYLAVRCSAGQVELEPCATGCIINSDFSGYDCL
jgi:hypothetical protein